MQVREQDNAGRGDKREYSNQRCELQVAMTPPRDWSAGHADTLVRPYE